MSLKKSKNAVGRAIHDYAMIRENHRVLLAVSGGMDSMVILNLLSILETRAPVRFSIFPVYIDPGFENSFVGELEAYIKENFGDIMKKAAISRGIFSVPWATYLTNIF